VVTGASSGIGEAFARALARDGFDLLLVARRRRVLERLARSLAEAHCIRAEAMAADLTRPASLRALERRIEREPRLELLVNDAGRGEFAPFWESARDTLEAELCLNALALLRLAHAALRPMRRRRRGAIVNVSSTASFVPCPRYAVYGATKAFVNSLTEALHEELRGSGVRVQTLCPGLTHTAIFDAAGADASSLPEFLWMTPEAVVEESLAGLARGEVVCVPGRGNRTLASIARMLPHAASSRVAAAFGRRFVRQIEERR